MWASDTLVHGTLFMATSRFIRFFSRREAKSQLKPLNSNNNSQSSSIKSTFNAKTHVIEKPQPTTSIKNGLVCTIVFLDGEDVNFEVDVSYQ